MFAEHKPELNEGVWDLLAEHSFSPDAYKCLVTVGKMEPHLPLKQNCYDGHVGVGCHLQ